MPPKCRGSEECEEGAGDVANAKVLAIGACGDGEIAFEDIHGKSMTAILIEILKQSPNPCLKCLMLGISYHTYHTLREVHASWNDFKLFVKNLKARFQEGQTLTADELGHIRRYDELKHLKPGKRTQHPQLSSQSKQDLRSRFSM